MNHKFHLIYDPDGAREYWVDVPLKRKTPWVRIVLELLGLIIALVGCFAGLMAVISWMEK